MVAVQERSKPSAETAPILSSVLAVSTILYLPQRSLVEVRRAELESAPLAKFDIALYLVQQGIVDLRKLTSDPDLLLEQNWHRHPTYPDVFAPPGFFIGRQYLAIYCQVTGDAFNYTRPIYTMEHHETGECLFVGSKGYDYLDKSIWHVKNKYGA